MSQETTRVLGAIVHEGLAIPQEQREQWLSKRCHGDEALVASLRGLMERAQASQDQSFLSPGGAMQGAVWDRLAEVLTREDSLTPGSQVGRYVVLEEVGAGGMGVVYAAWDPELDRKVALKLLHPDLPGPDEAGTRLRREAQAMARLSHPNVIAVHDVGLWNQRVFVAMEFVEGEHLGAWQTDAAHGWREVLGVYRRAGRGLAAAHAAGLVHRDFKPQNVLLGRDGRVRVVDFGLARSVAQAEEVLAEAETEIASPLPELTRPGSVAGTPAYMAPEQLLGESPDPRCDQFGFCVSLYHALWGLLPYSARSPSDLFRLYQSGYSPEPPSQPRVPKWVKTIVLRGLARDPSDRWPDMDSLLEALDRDPVRRHPVWMTVAALALLTALAWTLLRPSASSLCQGGQSRLAEAWNDGRRRQLVTSFERSGGEHAGLSQARTLAILDRYADDWIAAYREACEATHVRGEQSGELLDLRMVCLDRRRAELGALVDLLSNGGEQVLARAPEAVLGLEPLAICADAELLRAPVVRPRDPQRRRLLEDLELQLAAVKASVDAGREAAARSQAEALVAEAERLDFAPLEAEARWTLADLVERLGEFDAAADETFRSWTAAERGADEQYRLRALSLLVWIDGNDRARMDEAERWARLAKATLARLGGAGILEAELENNLGAALQTAGRPGEALEHHRRALLLRTEMLGPESYAVAKSLNNIGSALFTATRFEEALDHYQRALELLETILGRHPATAMALSNVGAAWVELRMPDQGRSAHEQALEMRRLLFGADSLWVGFSELNLALACLIDQPRKAQAHIEAARTIFRASLPEDHPYQAYIFSAQGHYLIATGQPAEAAPWLRRSIAIRAEAGTASTYAVAGDRFALARALFPEDRVRAVRIAEVARQDLTSAFDRDSPLLRDIESWLASPSTAGGPAGG